MSPKRRAPSRLLSKDCRHLYARSKHIVKTKIVLLLPSSVESNVPNCQRQDRLAEKVVALLKLLITSVGELGRRCLVSRSAACGLFPKCGEHGRNRATVRARVYLPIYLYIYYRLSVILMYSLSHVASARSDRSIPLSLVRLLAGSCNRRLHNGLIERYLANHVEASSTPHAKKV